MHHPNPVPSETDRYDRKSLRTVTGKTADWSELAKDAVAFANARGGEIDIGIEDKSTEPPAGQMVSDELVTQVQRRIREQTSGVPCTAEKRRAATGAEFLRVTIAVATPIASTSDGRYYLRVGDESVPVVGADIQALIADRSGGTWETQLGARVPVAKADPGKRAKLLADLRASDRVRAEVKEKPDDELLEHYALAEGETMTHLGVLLIGKTLDRARLGVAPTIQAIKYDALGNKVNKWSWDDHSLNPMQLIEAAWEQIPDFRETYEVPDGMLREHVPAYDQVVVRELLVNAIVHRPYSMSGDIFIRLHPDRMEVMNPGRLPIGVTTANILHKTKRRNDGLARIFHDLKLMEREGTGFDKIYEVLLSQGRKPPVPTEGPDSVTVCVERRLLNPRVIRLLSTVNSRHELTQREKICLGLLGLGDGMTAKELCAALELETADALRSWIGRSVERGLIKTSGKTTALRYFVAPELFDGSPIAKTTLKRIEPHRLEALIEEDLKRYPNSSITDIHQRSCPELSVSPVESALKRMKANGVVGSAGTRRWCRYFLLN